MACDFFSINGNSHSELAKYLNNINNGNEDLTTDQMKYFRSQAFIDSFGNYMEAYQQNFVGEYDEMLGRLNETMEPLLQLDEEVNKHYYLDKNNQRIYFPLVKKGLRSILTYDDINRVSSRLALTYFNKSKIDFNDVDFESGEKLPDLKSFITSEINNKVNQLSQSNELDDILSLDIVEPLLDYTDELTTEVENFFKRISLNIIEDENTLNEDEIAEDTKDPAFNMASFERDSKANVTTNVKLRLSLLQNPDVLDPIWNEPTFMKFDEVYSTLATVLTDIVDLPSEDVFDIYKDNISRIISKKPYLQDIYDYITAKSFTENKQNEFIQAFRLHKNNHQISQSITIDNEVTYNTLGISDSGNKTNLVLDNWFTDFKDKYLTKDNEIKPQTINSLKLINDGFNKLNTRYNKLKNDYNLEEENTIVNSYLKGLEQLGITLTKNGFENYLDNYNQNITEEHRIQKISEALYRTSTGVDSIIKSLSTNKVVYENPFFKASYLFRNFAQNEAFFIEEGSDSTVRSGGKQKWIYSYPSYLSTKIKQWKKNPMLLVDLRDSSEYNKGSFLLKYLTGQVNENGIENDLDSGEQLNLSKQRIDNFDIGIFNQMDVDGNFAATTDLSFKDYITDNVNKVLLNDFKRTITQADKTTEYQIKTGLNLSGFDGMSVDENGKSIILISNPAKKVFFNYFASEYNRMIEATNDVNNSKDGKDLTIHYHYRKGTDPKSMSGNAFKSQYFERLSPTATNLTSREKDIHNLIYGNKQPTLSKLTYESNPEITLAIENYIETELLKGIQRSYENLIKSEIISIDETGNSILNNLDKSIVSKYTKFNKNNKHGAALGVATDYYLNSVHNAIEYTKMFTGDMAYYKDAVDFKKRIPATYTDGLQLRIKPGQELFKIATIDSVQRSSPFYDKLVESLGEEGASPYKDINSADAQAWITPQRWKFLITGLGKWSKVHDGIYDKMMSETPIAYTEKELKIAAQPLKGVYFYREPSGKPVYLKYSQAVLSQALVKGSDLETLYNKMIDKKNPVDEVITLDGVKVGSIVPTKIHDKAGNMLPEFELNSQTLYNRGWKLQQDLPTKTYKSIDVGSQIQKNIFAGLKYNSTKKIFELDGQLVTGQVVMDEIVNTISGLSDKGLNNIKREFGINDNYEIGNIKGFYNVLIKELESRNGSENVINALKAEIALPGIPQAGSKLVNIFNSVMKDRLIKVKTNGGSFIQMSNFGLNKSEGNRQGVMWAPDAELTTSEPTIYIHPETLRKTVKPGGILVSGSFIAKYIPDYRKYTPEQLFGYTNETSNKESINIWAGNNQNTVLSNLAIRPFVYQNEKYNSVEEYFQLQKANYLKESLYENNLFGENSLESVTKNNQLVSDEIIKNENNPFKIKQLGRKFQGLDTKEWDKNALIEMEKVLKISFEQNPEALKTLLNTGNSQLTHNEDKGRWNKDFPNLLMKVRKELQKEQGYNIEERNGEFIEGIIDKKILENIIGYRIPNQGLASNDALRIVGILPESAGDTIVAYTGITTKTGSDFDVDKMFIMFPTFKNVDNKLIYDNKSLENRLIELYKSVLISTEVYPSVMTPIDIDFINNEINSLFDKTDNPTLFHFDPFEDIKLRYLFLGGKAGVGMEANAMVDISRTGELYFNDENIRWGHITDNGETDLNQEYSVELSKKDLDYYISAIKPSDINKLVNEISKVKIGDSYTAILNGFVDIAKDPVLPKGNWVTSTTNVGNLLLRAGVHPLYVINFMAQPIIKEYVDFQSSIEGLTSNDSGDTVYKFNKQQVLNALQDIDPKYSLIYERFFRNLNTDYKEEQLNSQLERGLRQVTYDSEMAKINKLKKEALSKIANTFGDVNVNNVVNTLITEHNKVFNPEKSIDVTNYDLKYFREQITNSRDSEFQTAILNEFKYLQNMSKKLGDNIRVSKADTDGPGKNVNSLFSMINLKQNILDKEDIQGNLKGFSSKFVNSPLGVYWNQILEISKIVNANPILFPQGQFQIQDMFNEVAYDLYKSPAINVEMMSDLEVSYNSYLMSNFFDLNKEETTDLINNFPSKFKTFKSKNSGRYFMLEELNVKEARSKTDIEVVGLNNRKKSPTYEKEFVDSWQDLFIDNPKFAEDLVKYSFVTSGFKMNSTQFFTYIPYSYFVENNINQYVNNLTDKNQSDFIDLFYRNNLTNKKYVKKLLPSKVKIAPIDTQNGKLAFQIEGVNRNANYYVEYNSQYYKLEGYTPKRDSFRTIIGYNPVYIAIKPASNAINGNNIPNYSSYHNNDLYVANEEDIKSFKAYVTEERDNDVYDNLNSQENILAEEITEESITIEKDDVELLWDEYQDRIQQKHPNETIEHLEMLEQDMGIDKLREYLKKCY